jgi:hypothetical protein
MKDIFEMTMAFALLIFLAAVCAMTVHAVYATLYP